MKKIQTSIRIDNELKERATKAAEKNGFRGWVAFMTWALTKILNEMGE